MKRQRSRGPQRSGNQNPNRAYESNGPDMRVRGSAQTVLERYGQAGRDAMSAGDRVLAENCFQHAEHYLRLIKATQPNFIPRTEMAIAGFPNGFDEDGEAIESTDGETEVSGENGAREGQNNRNWNQNENGRDNNRDRNNRNNRNRNRDRYRPDRNQDGAVAGDEENQRNSEIDANTESQHETVAENSDSPREARAPRPPRQRRPRPEAVEGADSGFGDELPAFLATPAPKIDAE